MIPPHSPHFLFLVLSLFILTDIAELHEPDLLNTATFIRRCGRAV